MPKLPLRPGTVIDALILNMRPLKLHTTVVILNCDSSSTIIHEDVRRAAGARQRDAALCRDECCGFAAGPNVPFGCFG